jgi:hypothetical protein
MSGKWLVIARDVLELCNIGDGSMRKLVLGSIIPRDRLISWWRFRLRFGHYFVVDRVP